MRDNVGGGVGASPVPAGSGEYRFCCSCVPSPEEDRQSTPSLWAPFDAFYHVFHSIFFSTRHKINFYKANQFVILRVNSHHCVISEMNIGSKPVKLERIFNLRCRNNKHQWRWRGRGNGSLPKRIQACLIWTAPDYSARPKPFSNSCSETARTQCFCWKGVSMCCLQSPGMSAAWAKEHGVGKWYRGFLTSRCFSCSLGHWEGWEIELL